MTDYSTLPPIGRTGINSGTGVRRLSNMPVTGWRDVSPSASFVAGQLGTLTTDSNGKVVVETVDSTADKVIGVFFTDNTTTFYSAAYAEEHTFGENAATPNVIYVKPYVKASSYVVCSTASTATGVRHTETTDFTIDTTSGAITNTLVGIAATSTVYVTYMYKDVNLSGINQTLGSGKAALLEEVGEIATIQYSTTSATAYVLGASIYYDSSGYLTATSGSSAIGFITKVPTADDPELYVKLALT
jgi:hypothetical protein